jgi:hypothetical protein
MQLLALALGLQYLQIPTGRRAAATVPTGGGDLFPSIMRPPTGSGSIPWMTCGRMSAPANRQRPSNHFSMSKRPINDRRLLIFNNFLTSKPLLITKGAALCQCLLDEHLALEQKMAICRVLVEWISSMHHLLVASLPLSPCMACLPDFPATVT